MFICSLILGMAKQTVEMTIKNKGEGWFFRNMLTFSNVYLWECVKHKHDSKLCCFQFLFGNFLRALRQI